MLELRTVTAKLHPKKTLEKSIEIIKSQYSFLKSINLLRL